MKVYVVEKMYDDGWQYNRDKLKVTFSKDKATKLMQDYIKDIENEFVEEKFEKTNLINCESGVCFIFEDGSYAKVIITETEVL